MASHVILNPEDHSIGKVLIPSFEFKAKLSIFRSPASRDPNENLQRPSRQHSDSFDDGVQEL